MKVHTRVIDSHATYHFVTAAEDNALVSPSKPTVACSLSTGLRGKLKGFSLEYFSSSAMAAGPAAAGPGALDTGLMN